MSLFGEVIIVAVILCLFFGLLWQFYANKLRLYIKNNDSELYEYLFGSMLLGTNDPITNLLNYWRYIFNNNNDGKVVKNYKRIIKLSIKLFLSIFLFIIIGSIIMGYLASSVK